MLEIEESRWSSRRIPLKQRLNEFRAMNDRSHGSWRVIEQQRETFTASLHSRKVDGVSFVRSFIAPLDGSRGDVEIKRDVDHFFCLVLVESGRAILRQSGNVSVLEPGDLAIWDSSRPAEMQFPMPFRQLGILVPHDRAIAFIPDIERRCGMSLAGTRGAGRVLRSHIKELESQLPHLDAAIRPTLINATLNFVGASFVPSEMALADAVRRPALQRVQDYVLAHLGDGDLSPHSIANALGFSVRYLHRLFEGFDFSVNGWIRRRRLLASQADLARGKSSTDTIAQIASRYGFVEAAHFSRAFKKAFGVSPKEFRDELDGADVGGNA